MADKTIGPSLAVWPARLACAATAIAITAALLGLDGQLGSLSFTLRRAIALVVLTFVAASAIASDRSWRISGWICLVASLALVARAPSVPVALLGFVIALAPIETRATSMTSGAKVPFGLVQVCLIYAALRFAFDLVPQAGTTTETIAQVASRYVSRVRGVDAAMSFTAVGGPGVALAILLLLWSWRGAGGIARPISVAALPLTWFAALAVVTPAVSAGPLTAFWRGSLHGLFWLGVGVLIVAFLPGERVAFPPGLEGASPSRVRGIPFMRRLALAVACLAAALAGGCLVGTSLLHPPAGRSILVHNRGGLDWERPVFGRFGAFSGGMFGLLPVYCRAEGYEFRIIDKEGIEAADLDKNQILILINSPRVWDDGERRTVLDFVARGGSLLVLGDHTDVFGLMRGFNSLLEPLGIRFRFDSAYKARENWRGCQAAAPDAVAWGWDEENPGVAVGASLEVSGTARALLTGRYGFSDTGVRENSIGSFLGNYRFDRGERLGDVVLVATATHGRGRVVIWGDTSAFQAVSSYYPRVVGPLFAWLARPAARTDHPPLRTAAALGLLAAMLWQWIARGTVFQATTIAASLLLGLMVPWFLGQSNRDARVLVSGDTVLIDRSHSPLSGHYNARVNPVGPLYTNLLRSGFRIAEMDDWDAAGLARARGVAFVAPQRSFTTREVEDILRAEQRGAVVLLTTGEPDSAGSRWLLDAHGLALVPRPMGTVTPAEPTASRRDRERQPRFLDAWPIVAADGAGNPAALPGVEVIYKRGEDVVALFRRKGKGGLLLISDTRFFSDMNIEDGPGYWPGNLALTHDMFRRYLGAEPDAVRPLFRPPDKTQ